LNRNWMILLVALVIVLDQWTKSLVSHSFAVSESRTVLQGFFDLTYVQNRGGAFGIMQGSGIGLVAVGFIVAGAIIVSALRGPSRPEALIAIGMALPLGGTIGNMIDRLRLGYVVDFFDVYVGSHHWPVFNVADSAICIGVGLIALWILRRPEPSLDESAATKTEG